MDVKNLSVIEEMIIKNKKKELFIELRNAAELIREKKYEIMCMAAVDDSDKENFVIDFLTSVIKEDKIPRIDDIVLPEESEKWLLEKGVNELLNK
ncbi:hypothetical protein [Bacillus cereus group sp. BfR-BA-01309]|uniref:hypothetical protein n=1 Tax=Bacillus cereus group sp. BfR-BA-01309 TaxID=2920286 RepID=UPI001F577FD4|nr:hypothetical protein [Bacillus cereus group sp. BfR-BA-01309]